MKIPANNKTRAALEKKSKNLGGNIKSDLFGSKKIKSPMHCFVLNMIRSGCNDRKMIAKALKVEFSTDSTSSIIPNMVAKKRITPSKCKKFVYINYEKICVKNGIWGIKKDKM